MGGPFDKQDGVLSTTSGYTGGKVNSPSYEQVSAGVTGHAESMQVLFDPKVMSYERLLDIFWHNIDPTTKDREFCDSGRQYRTAVFYHSEAQRAAAGVAELPVLRSGVDVVPEDVQEALIAHDLGVEQDLHGLGVPRHPRGDLLIAGAV